MSERDDFSEATKKIIASRAGYLCSFLGCGQLTLGPSNESSTSISKNGMACHISAASPGRGSRRYNFEMSIEERTHANNGIWMCYDHGKLIDDDESRFTTDILLKWKEIAEQTAKIMQERKCTYEDAVSIYNFSNLITDKISFNNLRHETEIIGNTLKDCCTEISWGKKSENITRDYLIELARNAFIHGSATEIELEILEDKIILIDNGNEFNPKKLLESKKIRGGFIAAETFQNNDCNLVTTYKRDYNKNIYSISKIRKAEDVESLTPCNLRITYDDFRKGTLDFSIFEHCNEIFVILPNFLTPSDIGLIINLRDELLKLEKQINIVYYDISEHLVKWIIDENPYWRIIKI